jgi:hypothetical protein
MGRKIRAAKASVVAAFLAASGAAAAKAVPTHATKSAKPASGTIKDDTASWGDPLIRFLKLDGFPAYLKFDGFAQLANYYKPQLVSEVPTLYLKDADQVAGLLDMYQKANAGPLSGILIGLEQYYKHQDIGPLLDYIKDADGLANYVKWTDFLSALERDAPDAFQFFYKETGIAGDPLQKPTDGGDGGVGIG